MQNSYFYILVLKWCIQGIYYGEILTKSFEVASKPWLYLSTNFSRNDISIFKKSLERQYEAYKGIRSALAVSVRYLTPSHQYIFGLHSVCIEQRTRHVGERSSFESVLSPALSRLHLNTLISPSLFVDLMMFSIVLSLQYALLAVMGAYVLLKRES